MKVKFRLCGCWIWLYGRWILVICWLDFDRVDVGFCLSGRWILDEWTLYFGCLNVGCWLCGRWI